MAWLLWLIASGVLAVAELFTMTLVLIMVAGGAAAASVTAALGGPVWLQVVVAIAVSLLLLGGVRPVARRHLNPPLPAMNSDGLVGKQATVLARVDRSGGQVRLNGGVWSARAFDETQEIGAGSDVIVVAIDGATAIVWREDKS